MRNTLKAFGAKIKKLLRSNTPGEYLIYSGLLLISITTLYINIIVGCYVLAVIFILLGVISLRVGR